MKNKNKIFDKKLFLETVVYMKFPFTKPKYKTSNTTLIANGVGSRVCKSFSWCKYVDITN